MRICPKTLLSCATLFLATSSAQAADRNDFPEFSAVEAAAIQFFTAAKRQPGDLISRSDVESVLSQIADLGWEVDDAKQITDATLADSHVMVRTFRTKSGQAFMRRVSGYKLIYDRLDRVSQVSGGQRLLRDIVKLPDGHRYARQRTTGAVPDLRALLPKVGNGRKRTIPDYEKPTGKIYTPVALMARLGESYAAAVQAQSSSR